MSGVSEWAMAKEAEDEYKGFLVKLVEREDITDKAAVGITKKVIAEGENSLSEKQRFVFKKEVQGKFPQPTCENCGETIPWNEAYEHIHGENMCSSCQHSYNKMMAE